MRSAAALLALVSAVAAQQGFNYGATNNDGSVRAQGDYENLFNAAKNLAGTSGFSSARLYTMIQGSTTNTPTSAIQAAIDTKTHLLLGLWGSAGQANIDNEIAALKAAIQQYGSAFTDLIDGISVGSEDLYRVSPTGIENKSGAGATPDELVSYINQVRSTISGTSASGAKIGHVDTWTAWVNGSNAAVINAVDWLGMDGYPYYQTTQANGIENGASLFFDSYNATIGVSGGKPVWITETGWPYQGPTANQAVASTQNAETYWQEVACRVLGNIPTWWYTLYDPQAFGALSFGLQSTVGGAPVYDLTCSAGTSKVQSSSAAPSSSAVSTKAATSSAAVNTPQSSSAVAPPVVSSSAASSVATPVVTSVVSEAGGKTYTHFQTTLVTITSCPSGCAESTTLAAPTTRPFPSSSAPAPSSTGKSCPTNLNGQFEYPHLIVPVDSANPDKAYGTSYNGEINPTVSSIFNFDIPASYAGKTCSLVFLFPEQSQLETSSFTFNNKGGVKVSELTGPATTSTTFNNAPATGGLSGSIASVAPGNSYLVASQACAAGQRIGFEFSSTGGLDLEYFQDFNPSPIGAYITVC